MVNENNHFTILHPALEIKDGIACVSFRRKSAVNGKIKEEDVHFLSSGDDIISTISDNVKLEEGNFIFESKLLAIDTAYLNQLITWISDPIPPEANAIYQSIKATLQVYLDLPPLSYGLMSAWIIGTYFNRAFPCYPYLSFLGPKETGKSNSLECLTSLSFNAVKTKLTQASLGDTADALRGTIIIDQAHNLEGELKDILVDSYKRGGGIRRVVDIGVKGRSTLSFDCYCPKAFAALEPLPDDLADRTFTINMAPAGKFYPSPSASKRDWKQIRTDLVKLMLTAHWEVTELINEMAEQEGNRFGELWLPIRVILSLVGADQQETQDIHNFCERQFSQVRYELNEWDYTLVDAVAHLAGEEITAEELLSMVRQDIDVADDHKPGKQWLGKGMKRLGLLREKKGNKHQTTYVLNKEQANKLLGGKEVIGGSE